ncbi:MAG: NmrA family NAD(P)-binding protein [Magnetospiraceae bacterium]
MSVQNKIIVLAGGTGHLGSLIAEALLGKPEVTLRMLVRPQSIEKVAALRDRGVEIIEADLEDAKAEAQLTKAVDGAYAVVSAVVGQDAMLDGQLRLLGAAARAGIRRFIPSYFSYDISGLSAGENTNTDMLHAFERAAEEVRGDVELVQIQIGAFADRAILFGFLGAFDVAKSEAFLWGDGSAKMDFTTYLDTARFTAEVAVDDAPVPAIVQFAGESLTFPELVKAYEEGSGKSVTVKNLGTLADLEREIETRMQTEPDNMFAWLPPMYWRALLSGKVKLRSIANDRYPHITPMTVAEYVRGEGL